MTSDIEKYTRLAEEYAKEAYDYRHKAGQNVENILARDAKQTLLIAANYYASMATYYTTRALLEKLNERD